MGSNEGHYHEQPQHTIELSAYWIGKYPVTNAEYQTFVRDAGHMLPNHPAREESSEKMLEEKEVI